MPDITMKRERTDRWTKMRYLAPGPAGRQHHVTCSPRWTASPLHPSLSFRYTQGGNLPRSLVPVLHAGAHEDAYASRGSDRRADGQPPQGVGLVRDHGTSRKCPPAPERSSPLEKSLGTPARTAPRTSLGVLAALCVGDSL